MPQLVQLVAALLVLGAFVLAQRAVIDGRSPVYLVPNMVGAAVLAVDASLDAEWGFVLLEGVWALVSAWSLAAKIRFE
jgi:hypothetical protein